MQRRERLVRHFPLLINQRGLSFAIWFSFYKNKRCYTPCGHIIRSVRACLYALGAIFCCETEMTFHVPASAHHRANFRQGSFFFPSSASSSLRVARSTPAKKWKLAFTLPELIIVVPVPVVIIPGGTRRNGLLFWSSSVSWLFKFKCCFIKCSEIGGISAAVKMRKTKNSWPIRATMTVGANYYNGSE